MPQYPATSCQTRGSTGWKPQPLYSGEEPEWAGCAVGGLQILEVRWMLHRRDRLIRVASMRLTRSLGLPDRKAHVAAAWRKSWKRTRSYQREGHTALFAAFASRFYPLPSKVQVRQIGADHLTSAQATVRAQRHDDVVGELLGAWCGHSDEQAHGVAVTQDAPFLAALLSSTDLAARV